MNAYRIEIKWGLIFVAMSLAWMALEKALGWHDEHIDKHAIYTNFVAIPAILIYVFALIEKRNKYYGGSMNYFQGLISGLIISIVVAVLSPITQIITSLLITPDFFTHAIDHAVNTGSMDRTEAEEYFNLNNYIILAVIGAPIMGTITSLVVAFFVKKNG